MKRTIALMVLAPALGIYLGFAFVLWELDVSRWSAVARAGLVFSCFGASLNLLWHRWTVDLWNEIGK